MKLLVVGASGLVGGELFSRAIKAGHQVLGVARSVDGAATRKVDLLLPGDVDSVLGEFSPDAIAIASAWPYVDGCEQDPARSLRENVESVRTVLRALRGTSTRVLFFSTDHVFDGKREFYLESDAVNPLSVYAKHKRLSEEALLEAGHSLIARTAWVFGAEARKKNFVYRVAGSDDPLYVPTGQMGCPTWAGWLAEESLARLTDGTEGVVHLTGTVPMSKAQWATFIREHLGLPPRVIHEVSPSDAGQIAPRPDRVVIRSERFKLSPPELGPILKSLTSAIV